MLRFNVLGPLEVERDGVSVDLGPRKQRAVLALLLMHPGRVVTTDRLLDAVWGEEGAGKENALWVTISRLRAALDVDRDTRGDSVLVTRDHGYALEIEPDDVDAHRFERMIATTHQRTRGDPARIVDHLGTALELWRGDPYEDFGYEEFAQTEIRHLQTLRDSAIEELLTARLATGVDSSLLGDLEAFAADHPTRETPVRLLMTAMYRSGRQADALRTYRAFESRIGDELGLEPSPELRRLEEQVLLHDMGHASRPNWAQGRTENPFKGLQVFREQDADAFFGRSRIVSDLIHRIASGQSLITLVGPSGSGKSSIVRAGLVPALRKQSLPDSDKWLIATMVPGAHPLVELEGALLRASFDTPSSLGEQLADPRTGVLRAALRVLPDEQSRLVLIVDQLEELFTLVNDDAVVTRFLEGLAEAAADPHHRVVVVATLRADFYSRILESARFGPAMTASVVNVLPLASDELEEAATRPAELAGARLEPALLGALISEVLGRPGSLPLFEYALTDLYDQAGGGSLTLADFVAIGGLNRSLTNRADSLFNALDAEEQRAAKQLFLRLVTIGDGDEWGRRRVPASELLSLDIDSLHLQSVVDVFAAHRLLTLDSDKTTRDPTVEVAHEALLTEWNRLREWIREARDDLRRYGVLSVAVAEWRAADRHVGYLWTGRRLDDYETWASRSAIELTEEDRSFLNASVDNRRRDDDEARATERRGRRRLVALLIALAGLAAVASVAIAGLFAPQPPRVLLFETAIGDIRLQMVNGLEQAARDFDIVTDRLFAVSDVNEEFAAALASDPDLVVVSSGVAELLYDGLEPYAASHPDSHFVVVGFLPDPAAPPNVTYATFSEEEGAYLAGVAAATMTRTGVVGYVGGVPAIVDRFRSGYEQGVQSVDATIEVLSTTSLANVDEMFIHRNAAADAAERLIARRADVVYHAIGLAGDGVLEAAEAQSVWAIGVDTDQAITADPRVRHIILTSTLKKHNAAVYVAVERFLAGEFDDIVLDVSNGGLDYSTTGDRLSAEAIAALEAAKAGIIDGSIVVREWPVAGVTAPPHADFIIDLTIDGSECTAHTSQVQLDVGDVLQADVSNDGSTPGWIVIAAADESEPIATVATVAIGSSATVSAEMRHEGRWVVFCALDNADQPIPATLVEVVTPEPTLELLVTFDGRTCDAEPSRPLVVGDVATVTFRNTTGNATDFAVLRLPPAFDFADGPSIADSARAEIAAAEAEADATVAAVAVFKHDSPWAALCFDQATETLFAADVQHVTRPSR